MPMPMSLAHYYQLQIQQDIQDGHDARELSCRSNALVRHANDDLFESVLKVHWKRLGWMEQQVARRRARMVEMHLSG